MTDATLDQRQLTDAPFLPYATQWIDEEDIEAVVKVLRGSWLSQGPTVKAFEAKVADACGARFAVAVSSGTAALHCAAFAAGIGSDDEVVLPTLTFVASANCVAYLGGRPVLADIDPRTVTVEPGEVARRITSKTKAVIAVDFAGHPAEMDEIGAIAKARGLVVIEDAAHSLGARYRGRRVGTLADLTSTLR